MGAKNSGRPIILEGGTKIDVLSIKPEDAQMLESRGFSVEEVCRFFGVPPFMVGHTQKVTSFGSGLEQQVLGFQKFTLRRRLKRIEQALEKQLLTPAERPPGSPLNSIWKDCCAAIARRGRLLSVGTDQRLDDDQRGPGKGKPASRRGRRCAAHADAERADHRGGQATGGIAGASRKS
ncbi:phage portal protein [Sinorhizobium meliloti]|uniref:phage portal protein n=1 Tax=Rhizobium meliloti TaxID=382 RepID=UPI0023803A0C|nr:phage portal protein [Sinorhizobium meliloti]